MSDNKIFIASRLGDGLFINYMYRVMDKLGFEATYDWTKVYLTTPENEFNEHDEVSNCIQGIYNADIVIFDLFNNEFIPSQDEKYPYWGNWIGIALGLQMEGKKHGKEKDIWVVSDKELPVVAHHSQDITVFKNWSEVISELHPLPDE